MIFIIKGFRTIVFIVIVISTTFWPICPPAFFICLSNSGNIAYRLKALIPEGSKKTIIWMLQVQSWLQSSNNTGILNTCTRLWLTESKQATPVDSIKDVVRSSVKVPEFDKHLRKAGGHIGRNVVEIAIKMKTIVRKPLMIKFKGPLHVDLPVLVKEQELIYISSVRTQGVVWKTCRERWMIEMDAEKESQLKSVLAARLDEKKRIHEKWCNESSIYLSNRIKRVFSSCGRVGTTA